MADIKRILEKAKTIAIVGLSPQKGRASNGIAEYLLNQGYRIIPVNPAFEEILGQKCYPSLADIPADITIDIVDVFRKGEDTPPIARAAVKAGAACLWLQLGITNEESKEIAQAAGIAFVQDRCIKVEHSRYY